MMGEGRRNCSTLWRKAILYAYAIAGLIAMAIVVVAGPLWLLLLPIVTAYAAGLMALERALGVPVGRRDEVD